MAEASVYTSQVLQAELTEEIADGAAQLLDYLGRYGLYDPYDEMLGRLRGKVELLSQIRFVLGATRPDRLDTGR